MLRVKCGWVLGFWLLHQKLSDLNCCVIGFPPSRVLSETLRSLTNSACIILLHPLLCYSVFECLSSCSTYLLKACWAVTFNIPELFNPTLVIPRLFYVFHQTMERFMMFMINWNTLNFLASTLKAKTTLQCLIIQSAEFTRSSKLQLRTAEHLSKRNIAEDSLYDQFCKFWWQNVWIHGSLHLSD